MELHESLYALGQSQGRALFEDPDGFRGALDDYLDEDAASTGDINLLVDAVRLGAFASMVTMLDSGADPANAIQEAGARLARDRGSSDVGSARWALAVLGYAVGKVSDAQVRRHRTQHYSAPPAAGAVGGPATTAPPPPRPVPPSEPTSRPQPTGQPWAAPPPPQQSPQQSFPPQQPQQSPPQGWQQSAPQSPPQSPPQSWQPSAPPKKKSKAVPIAIAAVLVLIVAGLGTGLALVFAGGGDDPGPGPDVEETLSLEPADIDERYAALGTSVTSGIDACEEADEVAGETEHLTCTSADGTLELVTYESAEQTESARTRTVSLDIGSQSEVYDDGSAFYSYDPADVESPSEPASVYWDFSAEQVSARLVGDDRTKLDTLVRNFEATSPTVEGPEAPSDPDLVDFADDFLNMSRCVRISNLADGELEENRCAAPQGITVFIAKFDSVGDFRTYRAARRQNSIDSGVTDYTKWEFQDSGVAREGALYEYLNTDENAVIYWDQPDCLCYAEGYLTSGDIDALYAWWQQA